MNIEDMVTFEVNGKKCVALVRKLTERECFRLMGVYDSYCDQFARPYTDYDFNTAHQFDSALEADDYARKRFFELQKEV